MELQGRLIELTKAGIGIAAISYDSENTLALFAERRGITFPLLSDDESAVIKEYGILNTVVGEGLGPNADDPDVVADIHRYVAAEVFDSPQLRRMINGAPFPGTFMLDENGRVTSRFFEEFYRERASTATVMLKSGIGLSPIEAIQGTTAQLKFTAYPSDTIVTNGKRFSLIVEVVPGPDMHLYAPGAEGMGYQVVGFNMAASEFVDYGHIDFPESEVYHFKPLDEFVPAYQAPFTLLQEAVINASAEIEEQLEDVDAITLSGTLDYQACDEAICYLPVSVPVSFNLEFQQLDYERSNR
ncbi:MAG: hypothetical protein CBC67_02285 [Gammaproteobacteria bacterium TMED107]|nr:hypothetical protein [Gammaproteobacteria bacterium]OUX76607.1 MAG: hypothetical protein CBC67_02285 [Gammaproteobacteria bacterium TMED107]